MGNCLDKSYSSSDESDENVTTSNATASAAATAAETTSSAESSERQRSTRRSYRTSSASANRYMTLIEEASASASSLNQLGSGRPRHQSFTNITRGNTNNSNYLSQSFSGAGSFMHGNNGGGGATATTAASRSMAFNTAMSSSLPISGTIDTANGTATATSMHSPNPSAQQVFYLTPNTHRTADQLTEEEQIKLLKRMTLIQQLPTGSWDENKKHKECVICMIDFEKNDTIKYLPCMHTFHQSCIDTWLLRSLICPSCMEPVDAGLLAAYE